MLRVLWLRLLLIIGVVLAPARAHVHAETRVWAFESVLVSCNWVRARCDPGNAAAKYDAAPELAVGYPLTAGGAGALASNAANAARLAMQLARQEAESAFTAAGELSQEAIQGARQIIPPGQLGNPAIPQGFGKFSTQTFQNPSGPFQVHFYMNPSTGKPFYGLDFKAIFVGERGPTYFRPFSGSTP